MRTRRVDAWWVEPGLTALRLVLFFGYLTLRAFNGTHVWFPPYISPTVAPPLFTPVSGYPGAVPVSQAWLGAFPSWWPAFLTPPSCAVRGVPGRYGGERTLLLFQNLHRYTLYTALFILVCLWCEAAAAFVLDGRFGVGVGTAVMVINAALLSAYTFGCHSWRHLIAGRYDCFSCGRSPLVRYGAWSWSSWLNERHMLIAWCSLVWVAFTDLYIYLLSTRGITDWNTW